jgi:hypothetical protein
VTYGGFVASVHRESSVALVKGNHGIFRAEVPLYTRASGHARVPGHLVPTAEIERTFPVLNFVCVQLCFCLTFLLFRFSFSASLSM